MSIQNFKFVLNSSFIATMSLLSVRSNEKFHHGGYMYVFDKYTKDRKRRCGDANGKIADVKHVYIAIQRPRKSLASKGLIYTQVTLQE